MGKKKDKQKMIQEARLQRKADKETKMKLRKKMAKGDAFKLTQVYLQYYADFDKELATSRIKLRDVRGDGNCLFRAFADQIDGTQDTQNIMRQEACKYMVAHQQFFEPFLDEDEDGNFRNYINTMKKSGEWGGHLELQALAECFKCLVVVHKRQREEFNIRPLCEQALTVVHLGYFQHQDFQHYASIREISDDSDFPAVAALERLNKSMYNLLLSDDPEEFLLRQQFQEMQIGQKVQEHQQQEMLQQEPYPGYPKTKKCKCGSKLDYKHCCFKQWQIKREARLKYQ